MSDPRPNTPPAEAVTARMYVATHAKHPSLDAVKLQVAYGNGRNADWASSTPTGSVDLSLAKGNGASRFFEAALEAGDDIEITFRRIPRDE
jgi:hypothetical protein